MGNGMAEYGNGKAEKRIAQDSNGKAEHDYAMAKHSMTQLWLRQQGSEGHWKGSVEYAQKIYQEKRRKK